MLDGYDLLEVQIEKADSQREFAREVGVDEAVISRLRQRKRLPSLELAIVLQERKGIPVASWKRPARRQRIARS